jgi:hypothetical protein
VAVVEFYKIPILINADIFGMHHRWFASASGQAREPPLVATSFSADVALSNCTVVGSGGVSPFSPVMLALAQWG